MKRFLHAGISAVALLAAASGAGAHEFKDQAGKLIQLEKPPQRLVTIVRAAPTVYYAADRTTDHFAAVNNDSIKQIATGIQGDLIPELLKLNGSAAQDGFAPNVEAILAAKPDLVIQAGHNPKFIEPLERVGLKVAIWACCTEEQRRDYITLTGAISGNPERAATIRALEDASNAKMQKAFTGLAEGKFTRMIEVDQLGDQIRVVANSSRTYALSGAKNLAADTSGEWWRTVDAEQILVWNPEVIIIPASALDLDPSAFYRHPLLAGVDAVKNKRIYKIPKFNRSPDLPEVYLTAVWLGMLAHPESETAKTAFRDQVRDAYDTIYGRKPTPDQINKILEVDQNQASKAYAKLFL
ncbi:ABC transporter substrate-binding protein [Lacibacterium aquatile]|uniref:ABC transporter substrate-binding protein n=1 Tax=Lacibacterium aquatile TaxID=1168082 RepID=A0ABW5DU88_9PROT